MRSRLTLDDAFDGSAVVVDWIETRSACRGSQSRIWILALPSPRCQASIRPSVPAMRCRKRTRTVTAASGMLFHQALGLHAPGSAPTVARVGARIQHAEVPALPVLHRRRAIRIENVALVQHRVGDFFHQFRVHREAVSFGRRKQQFFKRLLPSRNAHCASCTRYRRSKTSLRRTARRCSDNNASIMSRQTLTGSRNRASLSQEIGATCSAPVAVA